LFGRHIAASVNYQTNRQTMKKSLSLFALEFRLVIKQSLLFLLIATIVFSLALGVYSFSNDLMDNYYNELDRDIYENGAFRFWTDSSEADIIREVLPLAENANVWNVWDMRGILSDVLFSYGEKKFYSTNTFSEDINEWRFFAGRGITFFDELTASQERDISGFAQGRQWRASDNFANDGIYNIFISAMLAESLNASYNSIVSVTAIDEDFAPVFNVRVAGVFGNNEDMIVELFYFPLNLVLDMHDTKREYGFFPPILPIAFQINDARSIHPFYRILQNAYADGRFENVSAPWVLNSIQMMRTTEAILMALAYLMIVIAFFILSNILSILINSRGEFIAKLKLLGANSTTISLLYYTVFLALFIVSFALSIGLNFVMLNYYASIATNLFDFEFIIHARPLSILWMFLASLGLIALRYIFFRRKISKIEPLTLLRGS